MNRIAATLSADANQKRDVPSRLTYVALAMILALAALLRLWRLGAGGYGSLYYASGVLSMLDSWRNFFFNSFDPAGFVSIDKPPLALWLQAASAKLFGLSPWSVLLPQAIEGTAAVALLYHLVRRYWGCATGCWRHCSSHSRRSVLPSTAPTIPTALWCWGCLRRRGLARSPRSRVAGACCWCAWPCSVLPST